MHYKNGREAKFGDIVAGPSPYSSGGYIAGMLYNLNPGAETCNGNGAVPIPGGCEHPTVNVGEMLHIDDLIRAVEKLGVEQISA